MFTDNRGQPITPQRMRELGKSLGKLIDDRLQTEHLDSNLAPLLLASMLLGETQKQGWHLEQTVQFLTQLHRETVT